MDDELRLALAKIAAKRQDEQEFDLACQMYGDLLKKWPNEAQIYWNMALCDYRVVYTVEALDADPEISCYDVIDQPFTQNGHFQRAMELADTDSAIRYREMAGKIEAFQRELKAHSANQYDVFISFKKSDGNGNMTEDYTIAKRLENELHEKYRVFMSEFSLSEDNVADNYNTSIYNAIISAKYFILLTTKEEYLNTIWIANEWKRGNYLAKKDPRRHKMVVICREDVLGRFPAPIAKREALGFRDVEDAVHKLKMYFEGNSRFDRMENQVNIVRDYLAHNRFEEAARKCDEIVNMDNTYAQGHWLKMMSLLRCTEEKLPTMGVDFTPGRANGPYMYSFDLAIKYATAEQREQYQKIADCCMTNLANQYSYDGTMRDWMQKLRGDISAKIDPFAVKSKKILQIINSKSYMAPTIVSLVLSGVVFYFYDAIKGWLISTGDFSILWAGILGIVYNFLMMSAWSHIRKNKGGMFFAFLPLSIALMIGAMALYAVLDKPMMLDIMRIVPLGMAGLFLVNDILQLVFKSKNKKKFQIISGELNEMLRISVEKACEDLDVINKDFESKKPVPNAILHMAGATDVENIVHTVAAEKGFAKK